MNIDPPRGKVEFRFEFHDGGPPHHVCRVCRNEVMAIKEAMFDANEKFENYNEGVGKRQ